MSKINSIYQLAQAINASSVFPEELVNETIKENGWTVLDASPYICSDTEGRLLRPASGSAEAKVEILHEGRPAIRARIYGIHDPEEFEKEAIDNNIAKSPLFLRYDMYNAGCEDIGYIYFKPGNEELVRCTLCREQLYYGLE